MSNYADVARVKNLYLYGMITSKLGKLAGPGGIDVIIQQALDATKTQVDDYMGQRIDRVAGKTVRLDGAIGSNQLVLPNIPICKVTSCVIKLGFSQVLYQFQSIKHSASEMLNLPEDTGNADLMVIRDDGVIQWVIDNFTVAYSNAPLMTRGMFATGRYMVEVVYDYGFTDIPVEVANAHAIMAAIMVGELAAGQQFQGASMIKIGSVQRSWTNAAYAPLFSYWTATLIPALLRLYRIKSHKA